MPHRTDGYYRPLNILINQPCTRESIMDRVRFISSESGPESLPEPNLRNDACSWLQPVSFSNLAALLERMPPAGSNSIRPEVCLSKFAKLDKYWLASPTPPLVRMRSTPNVTNWSTALSLSQFHQTRDEKPIHKKCTHLLVPLQNAHRFAHAESALLKRFP